MRPLRGVTGTATFYRNPVGLDREALKRRSEAFNLAFLLLGGRRAANGFLDTVHPGLSDLPRSRVDASPLGLVEVVRVLRREALKTPVLGY